MEIDVIPLRLETSELLTVQAMGAALPVLLVLACLDTGRAYFVCLNDLIDKVIVPETPQFASRATRIIHVPVRNEITPSDRGLVPLRFYAKRAKLYAAFAKFGYQRNELGNLDLSPYSNREILSHFVWLWIVPVRARGWGGGRTRMDGDWPGPAHAEGAR